MVFATAAAAYHGDANHKSQKGQYPQIADEPHFRFLPSSPSISVNSKWGLTRTPTRAVRLPHAFQAGWKGAAAMLPVQLSSASSFHNGTTSNSIQWVSAISALDNFATLLAIPPGPLQHI